MDRGQIRTPSSYGTCSHLDHRAVDMKPVTLYAIDRLVFGAAALAAPAAAGRALAGDGGAAPDAQAFLRGMGGREIGLGLGLLREIRNGGSVRPWLIAGVFFDG